MAERWVPVVGYEGTHEVSDRGRVRSVSRTVQRSNGREMAVAGRVLSTRAQPKGYRIVTLVENGRLRTHTVHKLVLEGFSGPRPSGTVIRHINGKPDDNRIENLAWGTPSENQQDSLQHGTHAQAAKTTCRRGHPLAPPNLAKNNQRVCLACKREHDEAHAEGRAFDPIRADERYKDVLAGRRRHKSERRL